MRPLHPLGPTLRWFRAAVVSGLLGLAMLLGAVAVASARFATCGPSRIDAARAHGRLGMQLLAGAHGLLALALVLGAVSLSLLWRARRRLRGTVRDDEASAPVLGSLCSRDRSADTTMTQHDGKPSSIAFIGGGNMARSLIGGLVARGHDPRLIRVAEPVQALREALAADFGVAVCERAVEAAQDASVWLMAVKPQVMRDVCDGLRDLARTQAPLVVSIAAGITSAQLDRWLGGAAAVVRAMPNTPSLLGQGVTGLFAREDVTPPQRAEASALLEAGGPTVWIGDEALMDAVTAVSGSGPAYVFLLAEAMQAAAERQGLPAEAAALLVRQTIAGAAAMLMQAGEAPQVLRARVTSPGGTTQAAIETFQAGGFEALVDHAIDAATARGRQLSAAND